MSKFKRCDDCGTALCKENINKVKLGRALGLPKKYIGKDGYPYGTFVEVFWFCNDCFAFHDLASGKRVQEGSVLDKILQKRFKNKVTMKNTSPLEKKMMELNQNQ